jgi:hypothetical protein
MESSGGRWGKQAPVHDIAALTVPRLRHREVQHQTSHALSPFIVIATIRDPRLKV